MEAQFLRLSGIRGLINREPAQERCIPDNRLATSLMRRDVPVAPDTDIVSSNSEADLANDGTQEYLRLARRLTRTSLEISPAGEFAPYVIAFTAARLGWEVDAPY